MKILVIEDEEELLNFTLTYLRSEGYVCEEASTFQEGLDKINMYDYNCVIADIGLPDGNGLNLVRQLNSKLYTYEKQVHTMTIDF